MKRATLSSLAVPILAAGLLAGCGSSSKTAPAPGANAAAASTTTNASQGSTGAVNPYGNSSSSSGGSSSAQSVALVSAKKHGDLGTILATGPKHLTVYMFEADKNGKSNCSGPCAAAWPPVTGKGKAVAGANSADLGTITRADGTKQVTYKGHPLYLFVKDKDDEDAYGEGVHAFGADWYVLAPSGQKVDKS